MDVLIGLILLFGILLLCFGFGSAVGQLVAAIVAPRVIIVHPEDCDCNSCNTGNGRV